MEIILNLVWILLFCKRKKKFLICFVVIEISLNINCGYFQEFYVSYFIYYQKFSVDYRKMKRGKIQFFV